MQPHGNADMELDDKGPGQYAAKGGAFSGEVGEDLLISQAENARIRWKIDLVILPCITIAMTLAFLDKNGLSYAAVWGLRQDTGLAGQDYSWVAAVFYYGYLAAEFPTLWILKRVRIGKYISILVMVWGVVILTMAACHNFAGLVAVRVIMGILEAGLLPAFMVLNSMWWKKEEQALRTVFWFNTFAGVFGGILSYAIGTSLQDGALAIWKYIFLIYGAITIAFGIIMFFALPDHPSKAWFLTQREKDLAVLRTIENQTGVDAQSESIKWGQVKEALTSPKYWVLVVNMITQPITNAGVSNFNPLIISQFGYSPARTTLMATPQAAVAMIMGLTFSLICLKFKNLRCFFWFVGAVIGLAGAAMLHTLDPVKNQTACLVGIYMMGAYNIPWVFCISLATSNTAGRTKKGFMGISAGVWYAVGNIIGPQFFRGSESPRYPTGIKTMLASFAFMAASAVAYGTLCVLDNKRRDARGDKDAHTAVLQGELRGNNEDDLTDVQNRYFRYSY